MTDQSTVQDVAPDDPGTARAPRRRRAPRGTTSHARSFSPGFLAKLILIGTVDALGVYGILSAWAVSQWGILAFLVVALGAANWAYFSRRMLPAKYLVPGLVFLVVYQLFAMAYTGYVAFTNYGDGHNSTKADAITQIAAQNERRVEGSPALPLAVVQNGDELGLAVVTENGDTQVGTADQPFEDVDATVESGRITAVPGWEVLGFAQVAADQEAITSLRVPFSDDPADGSVRTQDGSTGYVFQSTLEYDAASDMFTDAETGTVYSPGEGGNFVSEDGQRLTPGWRVGVGFDNFTSMVTDSRMAGPFAQIFVWTFAFAFLSVVTTFALGLFLAITFNEPRVRGRKVYRSLLILPYAFPGFLSALVWRGMLNERFGLINEVLLGGASIPWLSDPWLAKAAIIGVNLWLGFPYMFLICTGALQSIPHDMTEAARIDGAGRWRIFRSLTLPLLMVSVAPLLISSFAFNFNNFSLIYMLTGGGPNFVGTPYVVGHTDILISMVYSVAFESGVKQYGVASALSIVIFLIVGVISYLGFRRTRTLEEI
jgi:arabinogalactan oligomer/maltooligosaccharide transport system permease protein